MAPLNNEYHKNHAVKEKLTFNDVIDFEIMQVKTQMICNGWERENKQTKQTKEKIKYHESQAFGNNM